MEKESVGVTQPITELSDEAAFLQVCRGNIERYEILYERHKGPIAGLIMKMTGSADDMEDLVADVFLTAYQKREQYNQSGTFKSWLYKIAVNTTRQHIRKQRFRRKAMADFARDPSTADSPDDRLKHRVEQGEMKDLLMSCLSRVKPKLREVFVLRDLEDMSYEEIAGIVGCPLGTVKSRLNSARAAMIKLAKESLNSMGD
jgi:RNA polymerase sigma-70 factor (ECF subfamily)